MAHRNIVVIGASQGGIETLREVLGPLPADLPATLLIVQHIGGDSPHQLATLLGRRTSLPVATAEDGASLRPGTAWVAQADYHLIVDSDQMFLSHGPRENRVRPAVDPLFRSAALSHGPRVVGVILSGALDDGTAGLLAVSQRGGVTVVQDPDDAITPDMPASALEHIDVDHCLPAAEIGPLIERLVREPLTATDGHDARRNVHDEDLRSLQREVAIMRDGKSEIDTTDSLGELVPVSCPDCGGPLWEMADGVRRFRCHIGHAFTARHLTAGLKEAEEQALYVALRTVEERVRMLRRLAGDDQGGQSRMRQEYVRRAEEAEEHVRQIRGLLGKEMAFT